MRIEASDGSQGFEKTGSIKQCHDVGTVLLRRAWLNERIHYMIYTQVKGTNYNDKCNYAGAAGAAVSMANLSWEISANPKYP